MSKELGKITGHANRTSVKKCRQINSATGELTVNFYGFMPVDGDATMTTLEARVSTDISGTAYNQTGNYFQNVYYPCEGSKIEVNAGEVLIYLDDQI